MALVLEDLIDKMKSHFPRWMDIRRKIKSSNGGHYLSSIAEEISDIQEAINDYKKDFFIDKYIGNEDEVLTYIYKFHIGVVNEKDLELINPSFLITNSDRDFYEHENIAYYNDGFIYLKQDYPEIEYSIDGFKSVVSSEKTHVWNIFDEFAAFLGLKRYLWESNKELLNRTLAFSNNQANSSEQGLKNAILNNLINIDKALTLEDISIERPTPENLNKYYDNFETILDHLANVNRDVYRTKRWDLDTWNFNIKSVDYIPHAWDIVLQYYTNGIGFDEDLKVEIVDADMKTNATIFFYKKTLEYINTYIKNNNIKDTIKLDLVKHSDTLVPINVKYRITGTETLELDTDQISIESCDYKKGLISQPVDYLFNEEVNEHQDIEIIDNGLLDSTKDYKIRFRSVDELKEMSIDSFKLINMKTKEVRSLAVAKPGFELTATDGVRCTLTKRYLAEKYHFSNIENAEKEIEGFVISNVEEPTTLTSNIDECPNEPIFYKYTAGEIPVAFQNIQRTNCYIENNSILSDTVSGEKFISVNIKANSFSCNIHGPHKIIYSINNGVPTTIERKIDNEVNPFVIDHYETPQDFNIKIILNPINNKQCAITDIMYSKYEFVITTDKGDIVNISNQNRLPNFRENNLHIKMKTYTGFSPVLEYVYIGTKVKDIIYGDIDFTPGEDERLIVSSTNCAVELDTFNDGMLEFSELDYTSDKTIIGLSNESYITIDLKDFKSYSTVSADRCFYEVQNYGSQTKDVIKIPAGVHLKRVNITGEYEKVLFKENLTNILKRKGYLTQHYNFSVAKTNNSIIVTNTRDENVDFLKIKKTDLIAHSSAKTKVSFNTNKIQAMFIDDSEGKLSSVTNEYEGHFDFISFYPISTKIYKAINECNVVSPETNVPQMINTFDNNYTIFTEDVMYYEIESLNNDFNVMFSRNKNLTKYSIDSSSIQISKKDQTILDFDFEEVTVVYDSILGNVIEIPDIFDVNRDKIETAKFIISNNDLEIQYLDKFNDKLHERDYVVTEIVAINELMCNKLKYCNVNQIEEIYILEKEDVKLEENVHFNILKLEGIINWIDKELSDKTKVFIKYNIRKPKYIKLSIDKLYEKVSFSTNAYELLNKIDLYEVNNNDNFNLAMYEEYEESDLISVKCENIGFEASVSKSILSFTKTLKNNTVAVKAGYYYLDGDEYYLFADENKNNIEHIDNLFFFNVIKENKKLYMNQTTKNEVANSAFNTSVIGTIFDLNCEDKKLEGISKINSITTCENFNYWKSVGMDLSIVKGLNGSGIKFKNSSHIDGYAFLDITERMKADNEKYVISFFMQGDGEAYLGEERKIYSQAGEFNKKAIVDPKIKALKSPIEDDIYELEFVNDNARNYYLIVKGNVTIDDIIVQKKKEYSLDNHTKNISYLNLDIVENIYANYETRLYLDDAQGALNDGTEVKDGYVTNSSYIDWGFTKTKDISTYDNFKKCILENVDVIKHNNGAYVRTTSNPGRITTEAMYVGNINTIRTLMFKINNVMFNNMKNFKIKVLTSQNAVTGFKEASIHLDNIGAIDGDKLSSYIKLIVEMPPNKVINNIELFTEYLSDETNNPPEVPVLSGTHTTKVLDAQYNTRFIVKSLGYELGTISMNNVVFSVRASKENTDSTVWTEWKNLNFVKDANNNYILDSRIVFEGYRYFQFRTVLKGANASVKIKHLDLEVI